MLRFPISGFLALGKPLKKNSSVERHEHVAAEFPSTRKYICSFYELGSVFFFLVGGGGGGEEVGVGDNHVSDINLSLVVCLYLH